MSGFVIGCRCLIGVVFVAAAASKLRSRPAFSAFTGSVRQLRLLPPRLAAPAAGAVVAAEAAIVVAMVVAPDIGFLLAAGLLLAVTVATITTIHRGVRARCQCFGTSGTNLGLRHVVRNAALLAVAAGGLAGLATAGGPAQPAGAVLAAAAGLVGGMVLVRLDDVIDLYTTNPT
ncbi:MauE/DoxX family redox-associated membrane protein [Phytohabitans sp. ZYX-F-186]|uniref:MauE/DoxX family redox-associated membrane protein n=1 Tax=Phytohabitans maris TaxID=3071409 RepID=A0ABU0ZTE8_9ACTN|nr:MauE/DoxX family redox-associated membrane protein [Phytohabitans sp. ZYX-F-186]MDQ7909752.1 MauE/DoxX family redox-associated membrane protein [Phytohabitans sp. ZYX-F-186]